VAAVIALVVIRDSGQRAEKSAVLARQAESQAKQRLAEVQAEELARRKAEAEKAAAQAATAKAETTVAMTNEELQKRNAELRVALSNAEDLRVSAEASEAKAETNEKAAIAAKKDTELLLAKEKQRASRLEAQLGSAAIDELK